VVLVFCGLPARATLAPTNVDTEAASNPSSPAPQSADGRAIANNPDQQLKLHEKCVKAGERAEQQAGAIVPGRSWTWRLDAKQSLEQLSELQRDLSALKESETAFEASLTPQQLSEFQTQVRRIHQLTRHLEHDVESLDNELRQGYPRRWHVAHDALDMQTEIHRWIKLHEHLAAKTGARAS
jgi:hypothetical protein